MEFQYRAKTSEGQIRDGAITAANEAEVIRALQQKSLFPLRIRVSNVNGSSSKFMLGFLQQMRTHTSPEVVALFTRQMASMISAGLPIVRALRSAARDQSSKKFQTMVESVAEQIEQGHSLSRAMSGFPGTFSKIYTGLLHTAEASGNLDLTFEHLAEYLERTEALRIKVKAALRYPYFVLGVMIAVMTLMMVKIIPMFAKIYDGLHVPLPRPTQILVDISNAIVHNLPIVVISLVISVIALNVLATTARGRLMLDAIKLRIPIMGRLLRLYILSRFARTLGILLTSGTHVLQALDVSKAVAGNLVLEHSIEDVRQDVERGTTMTAAIEQHPIFPDTMVSMIGTGEETGRLDDMLRRTAVFYEQQVYAAVDGLSSLIEPVIIVVLGSVVGMIILALYYPIFMMGSAIRTGM